MFNYRLSNAIFEGKMYVDTPWKHLSRCQIEVTLTKAADSCSKACPHTVRRLSSSYRPECKHQLPNSLWRIRSDHWTFKKNVRKKSLRQISWKIYSTCQECLLRTHRYRISKSNACCVGDSVWVQANQLLASSSDDIYEVMLISNRW